MNAEYTGFLYAAYKDVLAIEALAQDIDTHSEAIAFHAQQAGEKILKNVFDVNGVIPAKTHNLDYLLDEAIGKGWLTASKNEMRSALHLSQYAVLARYTDMPDISRGDALNAILDCNRICDAVERSGYPVLRINIQARFLNPERDSASLDNLHNDCPDENCDSDLSINKKHDDLVR